MQIHNIANVFFDDGTYTLFLNTSATGGEIIIRKRIGHGFRYYRKHVDNLEETNQVWENRTDYSYMIGHISDLLLAPLDNTSNQNTFSLLPRAISISPRLSAFYTQTEYLIQAVRKQTTSAKQVFVRGLSVLSTNQTFSYKLRLNPDIQEEGNASLDWKTQGEITFSNGSTRSRKDFISCTGGVLLDCSIVRLKSYIVLDLPQMVKLSENDIITLSVKGTSNGLGVHGNIKYYVQ